MTQIGGPGRAGHAGPIQLSSSDLEQAVVWVLEGESNLRDVAARLAVLYELLLQANPQILDPENLTPGQEIRVPTAGEPATEACAEVAPSKPSASEVQGRSMERQLESQMLKAQALGMMPPGSAGAETGAPGLKPGQLLTKEMWTQEMLTGDVTEDMLKNIASRSEFFNARLAAVQKPTEARVISAVDGSSVPLNPAEMSTGEQAEAMLARLQALGAKRLKIDERAPQGGVFRVEYGNDPRRHFYVGDLNVGLLIQRYAKYPKEVADRLTMVELRRHKLIG